MVAESHIEICHNRIENYFMLGGFFGADGGAMEIDNEFIAKSDIEIHHNYSRNNEGFLEIINGDFQNFRIHHNISEDYQEFIFFWGGRDCLIENNTVLCTQPQNSRVRVVFSFHADSMAVVRNNIFVVSSGLQVFSGENVYEAFHYNQLHYNNLYYCLDGSQTDPIGKTCGKGEIIADPLFVDFTKRDLHLTAGSPAVDTGTYIETTTDFDGHPLPFGKNFDMGAYEYVGKLFTAPAK
jgi:hypothetical protein